MTAQQDFFGAPEGYLFTATLADNLRFGGRCTVPRCSFFAARQAQLEGDVQAFPNGYDTLVGSGDHPEQRTTAAHNKPGLAGESANPGAG